ncbi:unnamed protein product [Gulo gulo]|uniref:Uncharacterized protein n=1 Tax=Gulo gulo TaxID=48420 RepID=A0A9X9M4E7_GULGU|nr:unnamed protein product [Gulo gulo]
MWTVSSADTGQGGTESVSRSLCLEQSQQLAQLYPSENPARRHSPLCMNLDLSS